jgi:hypothetical protein
MKGENRCLSWMRACAFVLNRVVLGLPYCHRMCDSKADRILIKMRGELDTLIHHLWITMAQKSLSRNV